MNVCVSSSAIIGFGGLWPLRKSATACFTIECFIIKYTTECFITGGSSDHDYFLPPLRPLQIPTCPVEIYLLQIHPAAMEKESIVSRKRRSETVEENALQTSAPFPTNLFRLLPQPSTSLHLDLNRQITSNSVEVNSTTNVPGHNVQFKSYTSVLNEDDDQDSLPLYIREQINEFNQIIQQQGQQLTSMFANQQKNIYKMIRLTTEETAEKKLKETTLELNKDKLKILEMDNIVGYLKGQIEKVRSHNRQLEGMLEVSKKQLVLAVNGKEKGETSGYSTAQQQEVDESSQVDMNQAEMPRCKVCGKGLPTMILWPCHHLCLCKRCEVGAKTCPCCGTTIISSSIVLFP